MENCINNMKLPPVFAERYTMQIGVPGNADNTFWSNPSVPHKR